MHIFHTFFAIFGQKNFFFQKSGFVSFLEPQKATLMPKIRKNYGAVRAESIRTDARKYESKSIVPPKFLGRSKNTKIMFLNYGYVISKCSKILNIWSQTLIFFANNVFLPIFSSYALGFFTAFPSFAVEGGTLRWITLYRD